MNKIFKITYNDEFECIDEEHAYETLLDYLKECVENQDVCAFGFEEVSSDKKTIKIILKKKEKAKFSVDSHNE